MSAILAIAGLATAALLAERPAERQERSARRLVMDDTHRIPPAEWSYAEVVVAPSAALIQSEFEVLSSTPKVRLCLMRAHELDDYSRGRHNGCLASTRYTGGGRLVHAADHGHYALVVENRSGPATSESKVRLRIWLQPTRPGQVLPWWRQALTIATSLAVFLLLAVYSARKLLPAFRTHAEW